MFDFSSDVLYYLNKNISNKSSKSEQIIFVNIYTSVQLLFMTEKSYKSLYKTYFSRIISQICILKSFFLNQ